MENFQKISYAPMNQEERNKVRRGLYFIPFFTLFSGGIFYAMLSFTRGDGFFFYAVCGMASLFAGVIFWATRGIILDLRDNEKNIVQGVITYKEIYHTKSSKGHSSTRYVFHFGKKKMYVDASLYHKFASGDLVEIHKAKRAYNVIFKTEKLKSGMLMEEVAKQKKYIETRDKKRLKLMFPLFLFLVIVVLTTVFASLSDCFYCPNEYPDSVTSWSDYEKDNSVNDPTEMEAEQTIVFFNDVLLDEEEEEINIILYELISQKKADAYIKYLDNKKPMSGNTLTGIQWLQMKFDEATRVYRPTTVLEMWKRILYNIIAIDALRPSYTFHVNKTKWSDLTERIITDKNLSYASVRAWFGNDKTVKELQEVLIEYVPEDTAYYSSGTNQFVKEVWASEFQLDSTHVDTYRYAKRMYGIKQYSN